MSEEIKDSAEISVDEKLDAAIQAKEQNETIDERTELLREVLAKETFIDPLNPELITKAYAQYDKNPQKMLEVLIIAFQNYCRKSIREAAILRIKNKVAVLPYDEAEHLKREAVEELSKRIKAEPDLERLLVMLLFKNHFWTWLRFGLKDIFAEQRRQPGHTINNYLNIRFHKLKSKKRFHTVADLVSYDLTEIVNSFKAAVLQKDIRIFDASPS